MKKKFSLLLLAITSFAFSQYGYRDSNMIGITLGLNQFTLNTSDIEAKPGTGWNIGLSMRGNFYNDWDAIYGLQFSEYNYKIVTKKGVSSDRDVNYKLPCANVTFQLSYKFIENHLSVEFGPMMQINGNAQIEKSDEANIVKGTAVTAKDFTKMGTVGVYPVIGITAGVRNARLNLTYQYGLTNMLGKVEGDFSGHASVINGNVIFYF
ncbi:outer membrane beta-barrel protein [Flavobacterium phycosphaerae]|uniref:outer membrane beta-barrel protein n=1 Tax=Flavobacterium phycosphaerae TaxID=2697515 RepID=UPI00138A62DE|nr:outer membrane beta-barrel protein [Flavobacterium phycosphaerae]